MRVLLVGQGGREHALAWGLARSARVDSLVVAPGNAGTAELAENRAVDPGDVRGMVDLALAVRADLVVVGPEAPLVDGLVDELEAAGIAAFGPRRDAARIEGSKAWAKEVCERGGVPVARSRTFTALGEATAYLDELPPPFVVKADGLAAGKGVVVTDDRDEAMRALKASLVDRVFGEAGARVLVEEHLEGREVSAFALTDGKTVLPLVLARDYKRALDGDLGPNTGGMGAHSPVPFAEPHRPAIEAILRDSVAGMAASGIEYRGLLYAGLMLTADGPKVLEFNCRFGDPETQVLVPRLASDLAEALEAAATGRLSEVTLRWSPEACVTVVLASGGYPGAYATGLPIDGLEDAAALPGAHVFHAGTDRREGRVVTAGGRVLAVSGLGPDLADARRRAYEACSLLSFDGMHHRRDIAKEVAGG
ncbi:MAG TPA: phosphoribosylamine--glycine ligase [Actinomycetota bacterium]